MQKSLASVEGHARSILYASVLAVTMPSWNSRLWTQATGPLAGWVRDLDSLDAPAAGTHCGPLSSAVISSVALRRQTEKLRSCVLRVQVAAHDIGPHK